MSQATWHTGDALTVLRTFPAASVDLIVTSPPFLALRSYLPADHEHKALEIGSEATPGAFLDVLLDVTEELARVLAPHGSLVVELGDTYSGSGGAGGDYAEGGMRDGAPGFDGSAVRGRSDIQRDTAAGIVPAKRSAALQRENGGAWPLAKSLCMIPSSYAWALAYGRNPWTGRTTDPWRVRNLVAWCRPNPPVGALGDKFRPGTSYLTVACKSAARYFDLDAVREEAKPHSVKYGDAETRARHGNDGYIVPERGDGGRMTYGLNPGGAPPLDWWEIPTHPYPGAHYATFPPELCVRPIKAMCPQKVCRVCGKPSERITEANYEPSDNRIANRGDRNRAGQFARAGGVSRTMRGIDDELIGGSEVGMNRLIAAPKTLGWSNCGCICAACDEHELAGSPLGCSHKWRRGTVLDPFAGSGTTLAVATGMGLDAIGIDLDPRNVELARQRIGMFLQEAAA